MTIQGHALLYKIGDFVGKVEHEAVSAPMPKLWYLLRLHPNYDLKAERQLLERGICVYVPKETKTVRSVWSRKVKRTVPLFPGAMFVPDFDADIQRLKKSADGIGGFVKYAGEAVRVSLPMMARVRQFEARMNRDPVKRKYRPDQAVRIIGGPFDLWEGRIERVDSNYRLSVLIEFLKREVRIEVDEDQVEAV
jgi:transcriptional antiterminator RfaH